LRREPAAHAFGLQVGMEPLGKLLVFRRVTDEAGVELKRLSGERMHVHDEVVGNATSAQKHLRNLATRFVDGINADGGRTLVPDGFEALSATEINISKVRCCCPSRGEVCLVQVRRAKICPR